MVPTGFSTSGGGEGLRALIWSLPEPESVGASTYIIVLEADDEGACGYLPEPDRPRQFKLGKSFARTRLGFIHTLRSMMLIDPATQSLRGLAAFFEGHLRVYLFGALWGTWIDEDGGRHNVKTPLAELHSPKLFIRVGESGDHIRIEFGVGKNNPEAFPASVRKRLRQGDSDFRIALDFAIPSGKFLKAEIVAVQPDTGVAIMTHPLEGFPLRWPPPSAVRPANKSERLPPSASASGAPASAPRNRAPASAPATGGAPPRPAGRSARPASSPPASPPPPPPSQSAAPSDAVPSEPRGAASSQPQPAQPSRLRSGPRLRLRPRTPGEVTPNPDSVPGARSGTTRTPSRPPGSSPRSPNNPSETDEAIAPPPPPSTSSYRLRPGQLSDPLGRKTPLTGSGAQEAPTLAGPPPFPERGRVIGPEEPAARSRPEPLPKTEHLSTRELIELLRNEADSDRRWKIMEQNLLMGRAERTYALIANFAELISERSPDWPAARLRSAFASQPGAVLIGIMERWHMNQVLAVTESNSESAKILQWLREREVERMLRLPLDREITSAGEARRVLRVDRSADEPSIRKTWRILLQFLNADHGRSDEKAIHRQKDEIAKYLQSARDYLLRITFH
jgi:hypothetical protein